MVRWLGFLPSETLILGLPHPGEAQADVSQASSLMSRTAVGGEETQSLLKMSPGGINYTLLKGPEGEQAGTERQQPSGCSSARKGGKCRYSMAISASDSLQDSLQKTDVKIPFMRRIHVF